MNCYDGWAPCATDAWTSVDQQFRDGVTSCVEQDSQFVLFKFIEHLYRFGLIILRRYTIQAQLGPVANPFSASLTRAERTTTDAASSAAATIWKTYFDIPTLRSDTAAYASTPSSYTQEPTLAPHKNAEAASKSGTPVGTIVGMIIFGCVVVMVWILCFKFAKKKTKPMKEQMVREEYHKPELGASEGRPQIVSPVPEIGADERSLQELNPAVEYSEMVGSTLVHELDV